MKMRRFILSGALTLAAAVAAVIFGNLSNGTLVEAAHACGEFSQQDTRCYARVEQTGGAWGGVEANWDIQDIYCSLTPGTLQTWGIASTWVTDPPNSDAIWDNAMYYHRD
ncbi:MAG: hypothetical protein Q7R39_12245 [Dehalococcoidia bacterium]|nr:hypothetical protein [Dehalococcoidia bacterium]